MSVDKLVVKDLVTEHGNLTAGGLLLRNLAWTMEQTDKGGPQVGPEMLHFIADGMFERLDAMQEAIERLQAATGGAA